MSSLDRRSKWKRDMSHRDKEKNHQSSGDKICWNFRKSGSCRFGSNCKFSHGRGGPSDHRGSAVNTPSRHQDLKDDASEETESYNDWKYLLKRRTIGYGPMPIQLHGFWASSLKILQGNSHQCHQRLAHDLVDDKLSGSDHIHRTLAIRPDRNTDEFELITSFLRTITHPSILDSMSLSTDVSTLYNIISGFGGELVIPFFTGICRGFLKLGRNGSDYIRSQSSELCIISMLEALHQLLRRVKRVALHEEIDEMLEHLQDALKLLDQADVLNQTVSVQSNRINSLRRIIDLSTGRLEKPREDGDTQNSVVSESAAINEFSYPIMMELPGKAHDNDKMDITQISIIPTAIELRSNEVEYLPSSDFRQPHFLTDPVQRYLDTQFRLLRHDAFGPLKEAYNAAIASLNGSSLSSREIHQGINAHLYLKTRITHIAVDRRRGLEIHLSFDLPHQMRKGSKKQRQLLWESSKRLESGSLICLVSSTAGQVSDSILFIVVEKGSGKLEKSQQDSKNDFRETIVVKLASLREADLRMVVQLYSQSTRGVLLGIPGLIPATFVPILENIQKTFELGELPFQQWTIPRLSPTIRGDEAQVDNLSLPAYARQEAFTFDLGSITREAGRTLRLNPDSSLDDKLLLDRLENYTTLDRAQCRALVHALTSELALIQGPPGTGKSYLGVQLLRVLLASKEKATLGPIVIICYTNHALDQFLCHLLDVGISKIVRIGGRSQSPQLENHNLRDISKRMQKTKHEGFVIRKTYSEVEEHFKIAGKRLATIHKSRKGSSWEIQKKILQRIHPSIYSQVYRDEEDGFEVVGRDALEVWAHPRDLKEKRKKATGQTTADLTEIIARANRDIFSLSLVERQTFLNSLLKNVQDEETGKLLLDIEAAEELWGTIDDVHKEVNRRVLQEADVIGITTTGLARDATMLRNLRAKVVICEEAGEVLEAHMISAMMPRVEHIIQIGDHRQLRPQINNYSLSLESKQGQAYQLDRSQFERLALGQAGLCPIPVAQLNIQRRMRPDIAKLIRPIYPELENHGSVINLPNVVGMRDNIFWLNHGYKEDGHKDGQIKSHSNEWEVGITKALVRHLIRQGVYNGSNIAVLTPYSGQLNKLRASFNSDFDISISDRDADMLATDGFQSHQENDMDSKAQKRFQKKRLAECVRLATVDNFQGEEAQVIIISLVRSNDEGKVGFLRTTNRVNVLLSRAQHGMYLIGNADTYSNTKLWADTQEELCKANALGDAFNLCCPRHKHTAIQCTEPEDFVKRSPEGGCSLPCEWRLDCGHGCLASCHSEAMHSAFLCPQSCPRRRSTCSHTCPKACGETCGPCLVTMIDIQLPCGHFKDVVPCWQLQELSSITCTTIVEKTVTSCGHTLEVLCGTEVNSDKFACTYPCDHILDCRHVCPGSCSKCRTADENGVSRETHKVCIEKCQRSHSTCNHICHRPCHSDTACPPCAKKCEVSCVHSRCSLSCSEPCPPCIEKCAWSCKHQGACSMPCAAPCDRLPCDERCSELLECGHQCPGLCGELCQAHPCQVCGSKGDARVDLLEFKSYAEIDVNETPIVALSCGHFFTAESLDGLVGLGTVYAINMQGTCIGLLQPSGVVAVPKCPDCKRPIQQHTTRRYNRFVNLAVMDETSKRFLVKGLNELQTLQIQVERAEVNLQPLMDVKENRKTPSAEAVSAVEDSRKVRDLQNLKQKADKFCKSMAEEQQPVYKLFNAIIASRKELCLETLVGDLSIHGIHRPIPEYRVLLGGRLARMRVREIILQHDFKRPFDTPGEEQPTLIAKMMEEANTFLLGCEEIIGDSNSQKLPNYSISSSLLYARAAKGMQASLSLIKPEDRDIVKASVEKARELITQGLKSCEMPFEGSQQLRQDLEQALKVFASEWYEHVSQEEIESIKSAMVSGPGGFVSHSGHWYRCANGHVFAIGECGMPMELAQCPSCGSPIGGQNHQMVDGMERATEME